MLPILVFFIAHWVLSVFFQTFFLHRYGAHKQFTMSHRWERFFYLMTFLTQGSSFLVPRAYAYLHREHHAFSDTERDPHSEPRTCETDRPRSIRLSPRRTRGECRSRCSSRLEFRAWC